MNDEDRVGFLIVAHVCIFHFNYALPSKLTVVFLPIENHQPCIGLQGKRHFVVCAASV